MARESKNGLMARVTLVNGRIIEHMVKESFSMRMGTHTRVNGQMIKLMDKESTYMIMARNIKACGLMISSMVMVLRLGWTTALILVSTSTVKNTDMEYINGLTSRGIWVNGKKIK